ncbi:MAG: 30S ribosome-binding factor RbfA [Lachnospiraceae bacterium]|nr:30S ribosome-binding factor RbfA [Lachnospiraceae bacterium]
MKKNSVKNIRINSEVQREMSQIIREDLKDPRIHPMTSVMAVEVTPDLKYAKIFVSVLGDDAAKEKTMEGLKKSASYARHQLAGRMNLRNTPELTFVLDNSIEYGVAMAKRIDEVNKVE